MKSIVLILTGLPGSGKTTAATFFKKNKISVVRMGEITEKILREEGLRTSEENEKRIRINMRQTYGDDIYARLITKDVLRKIESYPIVVVEGLRSLAELKYFKSHFPNLKTIYINTDDNLRYGRLEKRKTRPLKLELIKKRDQDELHILGLRSLKGKSDYVISNNSTLLKFYKEITLILDELNL